MTAVSTQIRASLIILLAFAVLDGVWIAFVALPLFQANLGAILSPSPNLAAVAAFYPIYAGAIHWLAVRPALAAGGIRTAIANAAVLGLAAYATFDLTGLAVIKGWTLGLAVIDIAWGITVSVLAAAAGYVAGRGSAADQHQTRPE